MHTVPAGRFAAAISYLLLTSVVLPNVAARTRYAAYDYDLTTPQYTPDGRLLQVEYATNACIREDSNPIVSVGINMPDGGDSWLIMATVSSPLSMQSNGHDLQNRQGETDEEDNQQDENEVHSFMKNSHQRTQFRIIEVPLSNSHHRSSTILVGLSGLLSDATSLLQIAYSHLEEEQRMFGWHRLGISPVGISVDGGDSDSLQLKMNRRSQPISTQPSETVLRLSRAIADECQKHAFGGGLRPIGASLLLAGMDAQHDIIKESNQPPVLHRSRVAMCETHPNGGCRGHVSAEKNNESGHIKTHQIIVSGGSPKAQHRLKNAIDHRLHQLYKRSSEVDNPSQDESTQINHELSDEKDTKMLRKVLQTTISSLVEEWKNRGDPMSSTSRRSLASLPSPQLPQMEVVITSPKLGTFRFTDTDVAQLMRSDP